MKPPFTVVKHIIKKQYLGGTSLSSESRIESIL